MLPVVTLDDKLLVVLLGAMCTVKLSAVLTLVKLVVM